MEFIDYYKILEIPKTAIMETNNLVLVEQFCSNFEVKFSFINSLNDYGLIEIIVLDDKKYISNEQLKDLKTGGPFSL